MTTPVTVNSTISFDGVSKSFGSAIALADVSFTAPAGRITAFVGRNGAGKSTAMRILLGMASPDAGVATIGGLPAAQLPVGTVGALVGAGAHPGTAVLHHLMIRADRLGLDRSAARATLESVDLGGVARRRIGKLSLGQKQRAGLASALLGRPPVLVLDEPMNGLDPDGVSWLRDRLRMAAADGATVLVSSHLLAELDQLADRVVVIARTVVWQGDIGRMNADGHDTIESLYRAVSPAAVGRVA